MTQRIYPWSTSPREGSQDIQMEMPNSNHSLHQGKIFSRCKYPRNVGVSVFCFVWVLLVTRVSFIMTFAVLCEIELRLSNCGIAAKTEIFQLMRQNSIKHHLIPSYITRLDYIGVFRLFEVRLIRDDICFITRGLAFFIWTIMIVYKRRCRAL